jgi:hypothetical protein
LTKNDVFVEVKDLGPDSENNLGVSCNPGKTVRKNWVVAEAMKSSLY